MISRMPNQLYIVVETIYKMFEIEVSIEVMELCRNPRHIIVRQGPKVHLALFENSYTECVQVPQLKKIVDKSMSKKRVNGALQF